MALMMPMRFAHTEGHLDLCYDVTGNHVLTCGPEGDVRVYKGSDDDDPVSYTVSQAAYAICCKSDYFYVATDNFTVQSYVFEDGEPHGLVTRFTAPPTHLVLNSAGTKIVAGASDFIVKIVDLSSKQQQAFEGHTAPVLSVALHPQETLLASSSCDGFVIVWDIENQTVVHKIAGLQKTNDFQSSKSLCRLKWSKDGKYLVVPVDKEVRIYDSTTYKLDFILTDDSINELVSIVTFSPCGTYLAASCRDGAILIWNFRTRTCITREKHEKSLTITALAWNPNGSHELAFCDNVGCLGAIVCKNIATERAADGKKPADSSAKESLDDLFDDDSTDDLLVAASTRPPAIIEDDEEDDENMAAIVKLKKQMSDLLGDDDDDNSKDTVYSEKVDTAAGSIPADTTAPPPVRTVIQPAFQPGSTPQHLTQRFMVWNSVGLVIQYTDDEAAINVEFHNTATHHAMHINNMAGHTMADLSTETLLLACESEQNELSKLVCMHFGSSDNCKEWQMSMPEGESIKAVCIGEGWVVAATDQRYLRLFTMTGVQRELVSIPGPIVTMAAFHNQLAIVYHRAAGLPGEQCLGIQLIQIGRKHKATLISNSLPLSHKATLVWIGFSAEGTPFTVDSQGITRMLNRGAANCWTPVANLKKHCKGKLDNYWVVGIHENPQQLRAVHCKGSRHPSTLPRPTVTLLPFQLPLCELSTDKADLEETYLRYTLFSDHLAWWTSQGYDCDESARADALMPQQEALMKLFALSCKKGLESRAQDVCRLMRGSHAVQLAIKYASRVNMLGLAGRLNEIARRHAEEELQGEIEEEEGESYANDTGGVDAAVDHSDHTDDVMITEDDDDDPMDGQEEERIAGPMLNLKPKKIKVAKPKYILHSQDEKKNPFKMQSQLSSSSVKGSRVFDTVDRSKQNNKISNGKNAANGLAETKKLAPTKIQPKLFKGKTSTKKVTPPSDSMQCTDTESESAANKSCAATAFQLWFTANREDLEEESPDVSETDLTVMAARRYKELSADEKQEWSRKATECASTKKRKLADETSKENKIAKTDTATNGTGAKTSKKLANFAFAK